MLKITFFVQNSRRRGIKGQLYVTGDGIRVVDDDTKVYYIILKNFKNLFKFGF